MLKQKQHTQRVSKQAKNKKVQPKKLQKKRPQQQIINKRQSTRHFSTTIEGQIDNNNQEEQLAPGELSIAQRQKWLHNKMRPVIVQTMHHFLIEYGAMDRPSKKNFQSTEQELFKSLLDHQLLLPLNQLPADEQHPYLKTPNPMTNNTENYQDFQQPILTALLGALEHLGVLPANYKNHYRQGVVPFNLPFQRGVFKTNTFDISQLVTEPPEDEESFKTIVDLYAMVLTSSGYADLPFSDQDMHFKTQYPPATETDLTPFTSKQVKINHFPLHDDKHPLIEHIKQSMMTDLAQNPNNLQQLVDDFFRNDVTETFNAVFGKQFVTNKQTVQLYALAQSVQTLLHEKYLYDEEDSAAPGTDNTNHEYVYNHIFAQPIMFKEDYEEQRAALERANAATVNAIDALPLAEELVEQQKQQQPPELTEAARLDVVAKYQQNLHITRITLLQQAKEQQQEHEQQIGQGNITLHKNIHKLPLLRDASVKEEFVKKHPELANTVKFRQELVDDFIKYEQTGDITQHITELCAHLNNFFRPDIVGYHMTTSQSQLFPKLTENAAPELTEDEIKQFHNVIGDLHMQNLADVMFKFNFMKDKSMTQGETSEILQNLNFFHLLTDSAPAVAQKDYENVVKACEDVFKKHQ